MLTLDHREVYILQIMLAINLNKLKASTLTSGVLAGSCTYVVLAVRPGSTKEQNLGALSVTVLTRQVERRVPCLKTGTFLYLYDLTVDEIHKKNLA